MKNILVLAYAISPTKGSEYAVAWNYVTKMSKYNNITVLFGTSGVHMGDCGEVMDYINNNPINNVTFIPITPNKKAYLLNFFNKRGFLNYSFYFAYKEWQKQVYIKAKQIVSKTQFDLVHMVGPIGFREPGFLWKLNLPYIWGPIGGTNLTDLSLLKHSPFLTRIKFIFRNYMNLYQLKYKNRVKQALRHTDVLLTATKNDQKNFRKYYNKESVYLPENSIDSEISLNASKFDSTKIHFLFIARIDQRKALHILLESIEKIQNKEKFHLDIVGDGPTKKSLEHYCIKHNISNFVTWYGQLPRYQAIQIFNKAHAMVITSLSEGNPTVIWEAMSHGVPTITLDHCGMHDVIVDNQNGIKIPIKTYEQVVNDLSYYISYFLQNPHKLAIMAKKTVELASNYTWEKREKVLLDCYDLALKRHKNEKNN